ncbi:MAG: alkaline phosphatase D family protein [Thermodesulfobacteriota bacterium]
MRRRVHGPVPLCGPSPSSPRLSRRRFLGGCGGALLLAACGDATRSGTQPLSCGPVDEGADVALPDEVREDPFALGVASGDPHPDAVVLWTRLALRSTPLAPLPPVAVPLVWEIARDEALRDVVGEGRALARPEAGHAVHVDVVGLEPATTYWYRFRAGPWASTTGRTRTAPAPGSTPGRVRFAVVSCQGYQTGFYGAYRHLAAEDLDFVLFVGDYIYELESSVAARPHGLPPPSTLDEFRRLYALNHADPDLQAAHAAFPWVLTWDDHEVEDNYAALEPGAIGIAIDPDARAKFPAKRAAAYRAWWENVPIRSCAPGADDGGLRIHRDLAFGDLVHLAVVDDRQYRSPIAVGEGAGNLPRLFGGGPQLPEAFDERRSLLGREQEAWLEGVLRRSTARWFVLGQQTVLAHVDRVPDDPGRGFSMDAWDGYVASRNRLLRAVRDAGTRNFVAVGGDIHTSAVTDLLLDYHVAGAPLVGTELVAPSITALELLAPELAAATLESPHIHLYDIERHGYLVCEASADGLRADYRYAAITSRDAALVAGTSWRIGDGAPGARPA